MLRFFRNIRRRLLDSGSLRKYFVYAIGEILLVMIGILLALQVNNWNQNVKTKQLEKQYLLNLKTEFQLNLEELERVKKHRQSVLRDQEILMALCGTETPDISSDSINKLLDNAVFVYITYFFNASTPVLEEIKSSGNFVNISNPKLRFYLNTWESKTSYMQGSEKEYLGYRNELLQLINKRGSMKEIAQVNPFQKIDG
ncbi:MAG: hypothetical protein IPJ74_08905 [Saprospiraceae bacterium]|nr:hypothetical protein [Saprospiraceae bacterium]